MTSDKGSLETAFLLRQIHVYFLQAVVKDSLCLYETIGNDFFKPYEHTNVAWVISLAGAENMYEFI